VERGDVQNIDDWFFGDWCFIVYAFEKKKNVRSDDQRLSGFCT
jgi:hypothetical protein